MTFFSLFFFALSSMDGFFLTERFQNPANYSTAPPRRHRANRYPPNRGPHASDYSMGDRYPATTARDCSGCMRGSRRTRVRFERYVRSNCVAITGFPTCRKYREIVSSRRICMTGRWRRSNPELRWSPRAHSQGRPFVGAQHAVRPYMLRPCMLRPYLRPYAVINNHNNPMHVIRHHHKFIQCDVAKM
jgi:hypothetical protein